MDLQTYPTCLQIALLRLPESTLVPMSNPGLHASLRHRLVVPPVLPLGVLDLVRKRQAAFLLVFGPVGPLALLAAVEDELACALEGAARLVASAADLGVGEELRHVCLLSLYSSAQWQGLMLVERGSTAEETRRRGARLKLSPALVRGGEACWGSLGLLDVLLSAGGQSFVAPFFTAPRGQCRVFSLDVAVGARWWAQTQVCGDAFVVVEGRRQSIDDLLLLPVPVFSRERLIKGRNCD